jgi:YVTN family beta-propeller protein
VLYVEDSPEVVLEVSALTDRRTATIAISNDSTDANPPASLAFDPASDQLWVLGPGALGVTALALSNNSIVRSLLMPSDCVTVGGLAFDPTTGAVWVACATSVLAFSASNDTLLFDENVSYADGAILYDPVSAQIVVSVWLDDTGENYGLDIFNPATYRLVENVSTGTYRMGVLALGGMVYEPATQQIVFTAAVPGGTWGVGVIGAATYTGLRSTAVPGHPEGLTAGNASSSDVYLAFYGSEKAGRFNLSQFALTGTARVNGTPAAIAFDPSDDEVDVATTDTAQLFVLSGTSLAVESVVPIGGAPSAIAYDNVTDSLWVADSNNVTVVSDRTGAIEAVIPSSFGPEAIAIDTGDDRAFVATYDDENVSVFNATSYRPVAVVAVDPNPLGLLVDTANGDVYASCLNGTQGLVDIISGTTYTVLGRLPVGYAPSNLIYDPVSGEIVVANEYSSNLSLISPSTQRIVGNVNLSGFYPWGLAYDPQDQELYLSDADLGINVATGNASSQIYALMASNYSLVASENVDPVTLGIAYAPAENLVLAASYLSDVVDVLDPASLAWVATVPVGDNPVAVLYDPGTSNVYVANTVSDNLTVLPVPPGSSPATYSVTFSEVGLPSGTVWTVTYDGTTRSGTGDITFSGIPNGTFLFQIAPIRGYSASPTGGSLGVVGSPAFLSVVFRASASTFLGLPTADGLAVLWGLTAAVVAAVAVAVLWRRHQNRRPRSGEPVGSSTEPTPRDPPPGSPPV